jgi:hypothetical protein
MPDLNKALGDLTSIRRQLARSTEFRGYGPATLSATGVLAILAAWVQTLCLLDPENHFGRYLAIWIWTAIISAVLIGVQMHARTRRIHSGLADEMIRMAVEQFLPSMIAGGLLTFVLVRSAPGNSWMLPGLWQVIFSIGVFSSCRFLPLQMLAAGAWYLFTGLFCLALGDSRALSPWAMGIPYAVGQFIVAGVLLLRSKEAIDET